VAAARAHAPITFVNFNYVIRGCILQEALDPEARGFEWMEAPREALAGPPRPSLISLIGRPVTAGAARNAQVHLQQCTCAPNWLHEEVSDGAKLDEGETTELDVGLEAWSALVQNGVNGDDIKAAFGARTV